jgi:hypothetical protein
MGRSGSVIGAAPQEAVTTMFAARDDESVPDLWMLSIWRAFNGRRERR